MTTPEEYPFWIAFANISGNILPLKAKYDIIIRCCHENGMPLSVFFEYCDERLVKDFNLSSEALSAVKTEKQKIPNYSFLAESMLSQGYEFIPVYDPEYPKSLKKHLGTHAPVLLYLKGNKKIMHKRCTAIVGARNAGSQAMAFTDNIASLSVSADSPIVSGYAKGVDRQAFDAAIKYGGESIIVLPQGIMTFTGFRSLYREIINSKVLVISTFQPKAPWNKGLAMARNSIIYALADDIYVAESNENGGTWEGVMDGLRKGRRILVRNPEGSEHNANRVLIQKGCIPVSFSGEVLPIMTNHSLFPEKNQDSTYGHIPACSILAEPINTYETMTVKLEQKIIQLLTENEMNLQQIKSAVAPDLSDNKLRTILNNIPGIAVKKQKNRNIYTLMHEQFLF